MTALASAAPAATAQRTTETSRNADNAMTDIDHARRVLLAEADALRQMADTTLNAEFIAAVDSIDRMAGRLIVAGIGKSGHVARKIAATLASTGTPSYYVHPGEASHGDLGMVARDDIVLLLSNSGENAELTDLIHYSRRFGIKLIAMTSNPDSTLGRHADIVLRLPRVPEACPNGLAPTTSTTMMIALGDALAVALLERTGLTPEQFRQFHPGGKLGQKLKLVTDLMHGMDDLPMVPETATMAEALLPMTEKNLGCVLVHGAQKTTLQGIITDGDLKRHMGPDLLSRPVTTVMSRKPRTIAGDALAVEALNLMTGDPAHYLSSLIVTGQDGALLGLIRLQDCIQAGLA